MKLKDLLRESEQVLSVTGFENIKINKSNVTAIGYMYDGDDNETKVKLTIDYSPSERDSMSGPGTDASAEITSITTSTGEKIAVNTVKYDADNLVEAVTEADKESKMPNED